MKNKNVVRKTYSRLVKGFSLIVKPGKANPTGFTLIELLLVIAIIGVLVGIVVVAINPVRLIAESRDSKKVQEMQQLKNALQLYFNDFNDYPTVAEFIPPCGAGNCFDSDYMREIPEEFTDSPATAIYSITTPPVPAGEYRAGMGLSTFISNPGNDDGTDKLCGGQESPSEVPTGGIWDTVDYFICPD